MDFVSVVHNTDIWRKVIIVYGWGSSFDNSYFCHIICLSVPLPLNQHFYMFPVSVSHEFSSDYQVPCLISPGELPKMMWFSVGYDINCFSIYYNFSKRLIVCFYARVVIIHLSSAFYDSALRYLYLSDILFSLSGSPALCPKICLWV